MSFLLGKISQAQAMEKEVQLQVQFLMYLKVHSPEWNKNQSKQSWQVFSSVKISGLLNGM